MRSTLLSSGLAGFAVAAISMAGSIASATTVDVLLTNFDDANNGQKYYSNDQMLFALTNFTSGNCATAESGNGSCLNERNGGQGMITTASRPNDLAGVLEDLDDAKNPKQLEGVLEDVSATELKTFTLVSFWFQLLGKGKKGDGPNGITVVDTGTQADPLFPDQDTAPVGPTSFTFLAGTQYANVVNFKTGVSEVIQKNNKFGYLATFTTEFANVKSISWYNKTSANIRVDCVTVSYLGAPNNSGDTCGVPVEPPPVPLPAAAWLMLAGLGGLGALKLRKKA